MALALGGEAQMRKRGAGELIGCVFGQVFLGDTAVVLADERLDRQGVVALAQTRGLRGDAFDQFLASGGDGHSGSQSRLVTSPWSLVTRGKPSVRLHQIRN